MPKRIYTPIVMKVNVKWWWECGGGGGGNSVFAEELT